MGKSKNFLIDGHHLAFNMVKEDEEDFQVLSPTSFYCVSGTSKVCHKSKSKVEKLLKAVGAYRIRPLMASLRFAENYLTTKNANNTKKGYNE